MVVVAISFGTYELMKYIQRYGFQEISITSAVCEIYIYILLNVEH